MIQINIISKINEKMIKMSSIEYVTRFDYYRV